VVMTPRLQRGYRRFESVPAHGMNPTIQAGFVPPGDANFCSATGLSINFSNATGYTHGQGAIKSPYR
jgi:hypothetical protein